MLTRLEVDGFKNLVDFALDFGPFTCVFGPNAAGKSNIFDAIKFLSLLTRLPINEAARRIRDGGDVANLFFGRPREPRTRMTFGVEMLVEHHVSDDFGRMAEPSSSFLRYEVVFRYEPSTAVSGRAAGLVLEREELRPITAGRAARHLKFPHSKNQFRDSVVYNRRHSRSGFISTNVDSATHDTSVIVHQDGGAQGLGRPAPAEQAVRTIIGTENTAATPTILAVRREMQNWLVLTLDPGSIRRPDRYTQPPGLGDSGAHIAATLQSAASRAETGEPTSVDLMATVSDRLSRLVPVNGVRVVRDDARQLLTFEVEEADGRSLPPELLADSTLRSLALVTLASAPNEGRVLCVEGPENGIYPSSLGAVNDLLHEMVVDTEEPIGVNNAMCQVIVTSHSPQLIQLQSAGDLVWADRENEIADSGGSVGRALRCVPHRGSWRCSDDNEGFDLGSMEPFRTHGNEAQIAFPLAMWDAE